MCACQERFFRNIVISYLLTFTFYILACKDNGSRASASSSRDVACSRMYQSRECRRVKLGLLFLNKTKTKLYTSYKLRCIECSILFVCMTSSIDPPLLSFVCLIISQYKKHSLSRFSCISYCINQNSCCRSLLSCRTKMSSVKVQRN